MKRIALLLSAATIAVAQTPTAENTHPATDNIPSFQLALTADNPVKTTESPGMRESQVACLSDGSIGVAITPCTMTDNKWTCGGNHSGPSILAPDGSAITIDSAKINDIKLQSGEVFVRWDATDHDVDLLYWVQKSIQEDPTLKTTYFIARFDPKGTYHGATELELGPYTPQTFATFPNGDLAIIGLDKANQQVDLLHYAMIGGKMSLFIPDKPLAKSDPGLPLPITDNAKSRFSKEELQAMRLDLSTQIGVMAHYKDAILLLQPESSAPLFEMFSNGTITTLPIPKLAGLSPISILPSNDSIFLEYGVVQKYGYSPTLLLAIDPQTGHPLRQISLNHLTPVCEHLDTFLVLQDKVQKPIELRNAIALSK